MPEANMLRSDLLKKPTGFFCRHLSFNNNIPINRQLQSNRPPIRSAIYDMDTLLSAMRTSAIIASTIIVIVALVVTTWTLGVKLAEPFGVIMFNTFVGIGRVLDDQEASSTHKDESVKKSQREARKRVERVLSGTIAMFLVFCTIVVEQALAGVGINYISLWDYSILVLKGIFEALAALGMLRLALAAARKLMSS